MITDEKGVLSTPARTNVPTKGMTAVTTMMMMMMITINENYPENIPSAYTVAEIAEQYKLNFNACT